MGGPCHGGHWVGRLRPRAVRGPAVEPADGVDPQPAGRRRFRRCRERDQRGVGGRDGRGSGARRHVAGRPVPTLDRGGTTPVAVAGGGRRCATRVRGCVLRRRAGPSAGGVAARRWVHRPGRGGRGPGDHSSITCTTWSGSSARALTYLLVSAVLAATYVAVVITVAQVLGTAGGRSEVAAVLATLAAVSVAAPAYRRVQVTIDSALQPAPIRRGPGCAGLRPASDRRRRHRGCSGSSPRRSDASGGLLGRGSGAVGFCTGQPALPAANDLIVQRHGRPIASVGFDPNYVEA